MKQASRVEWRVSYPTTSCLSFWKVHLSFWKVHLYHKIDWNSRETSRINVSELSSVGPGRCKSSEDVVIGTHPDCAHAHCTTKSSVYIAYTPIARDTTSSSSHPCCSVECSCKPCMWTHWNTLSISRCTLISETVVRQAQGKWYINVVRYQYSMCGSVIMINVGLTQAHPN